MKTIAAIGVFLVLFSAGKAQAQVDAAAGSAVANSSDPISRLTQTEVPTFPDEVQMTVPPVIERPLGVDEGPRVYVDRFIIQVDGEIANAWRNGAFIDDLQRMFDNRRSTQGPDGMTIGQLEQLTREATDWLRNEGLMVGRVYLPVQTVESGEVTVAVLQGRLGAVEPDGNNMYSSQKLLRPFAALEGQPIDRDAVDRVLRQINDYPGLTATGVFAPGNEVGTTALSLRVRNEKRFNSSIGLDNFGTEFTGEYRARFSTRANNVTGNADFIDFDVLGTQEPDNALFGSFLYSVPLFGPGRNVSFRYQNNDFDITGEAFPNDVVGTTEIYALGYEHVLRQGRDFNASFIAGLAKKNAELEELQLLGPTFLGRDKLTVGSFGVTFDFIDRQAGGINRGSLIYMHGFDDFLGSLLENDPESSRSIPNLGINAGGKFDKWYMNFTRLQRFSDTVTMLLRLEAQQSDDFLVSLEQFSLGGPTSVRAYSPSQFLVDSGAFASVEMIFAAPGFHSKPAFNNRSWGEVLQLSVFYDYAGGYRSDFLDLNRNTLSDDENLDLDGIGIGLRFNPTAQFSARLDAAWPSGGIEPDNGREPQLYFSLNFTF
ncbi:MAG: ShlB/FhaC/HecB family hemolysin secretion/activation protein [Gammaproteobacteria bacterium]|nr:ShlB/FhaC/HecB family hemolysin secretion/activation protein [Gammaproteobacteria bacterium]